MHGGDMLPLSLYLVFLSLFIVHYQLFLFIVIIIYYASTLAVPGFYHWHYSIPGFYRWHYYFHHDEWQWWWWWWWWWTIAHYAVEIWQRSHVTFIAIELFPFQNKEHIRIGNWIFFFHRIWHYFTNTRR